MDVILPWIKWKVSEAPTGLYRSFQKRGWPHATYPNGLTCASLDCEEDYVPSLAKAGKHPPLTLRVADYSRTPWKWVKVNKTYQTLGDAKQGLVNVLKKYPHLLPEEYRPQETPTK